MTLEKIHPNEYKFDYEGVYHRGSGCNKWVCPADDFGQVIKDIDNHEREEHQAKVIPFQRG